LINHRDTKKRTTEEHKGFFVRLFDLKASMLQRKLDWLEIPK